MPLTVFIKFWPFWCRVSFKKLSYFTEITSNNYMFNPSTPKIWLLILSALLYFLVNKLQVILLDKCTYQWFAPGLGWEGGQATCRKLIGRVLLRWGFWHLPTDFRSGVWPTCHVRSPAGDFENLKMPYSPGLANLNAKLVNLNNKLITSLIKKACITEST